MQEKKFAYVFPYAAMEKYKQTFWLTQYIMKWSPMECTILFSRHEMAILTRTSKQKAIFESTI